MIAPLQNLPTEDALAIAVAILSGEDPSVALARELTSTFSTVTPPMSWLREWAITLVRSAPHHPVVKGGLARCRLAKIERNYQMYLLLSCGAICDQSAQRWGILLANQDEEIHGILRGDRNMEIEKNRDRLDESADELTVRVFIGEIHLRATELLALQRGEQLQCALPSEMLATIHGLGGVLGSGVIKVGNGEISLKIKQLFNAPLDY